MSSKLEQLRAYTAIVADTGDIAAIAPFKPLDATTNPSLLLKTVQLPHYAPLLRAARLWAADCAGGSSVEQRSACADKLAVNIGCAILQLIPGRVSTEVDARLSYDTDATVEKARRIIDLYQQAGVDQSRVLIKIAATWQGIRAAELLEREGIRCNLTLLFSFAQAVACADAGVFLISPFVGRIYDWHCAHTGNDYLPTEDPGVQSVTRIYHYYKHYGYSTLVMGASFRHTGQIEQLAGCDRLTISPALLQALDADHGDLQRQLNPKQAMVADEKQAIDEQAFTNAIDNDAMTKEKLAEGIRLFSEDQIKLEEYLESFGSSQC